ncbi:MAG: glycosyltransferase family 4 protein [bacterium]|nr:glycosyltransferase family 4 protein [bacterium]
MTKPVHILFISEYWPPDPGGMAVYAGEIVTRFVKMGHQVTLVLPDRGERNPVGNENLQVLLFSVPKVHALGRLAILPVLFRQIDWVAIDVVIDLSVFPYAGVTALFCKHYKKPHYIGAHGNEVSRLFPGNGLSRVFTHYCLYAYRNATGIAANSHFTANHFRQWQIPMERIHVIPCGVNTDFFTPASPSEQELREIGGSVTGVRLVYAAMLTRLKGHELFLQSLPLIQKEFPSVTVDFAGTGPLEAELKQLAKELKVDNLIRWHGQLPQSKLRTLFRAANLTVLATRNDPKYYEGFGLVIAEAMACGCPVAVTNVGGQTEFVSEDTGILFEAENSLDIATKVIQLLQNPEQLQAMRQQARQTIQQDYTWDHSAEKWQRLLLTTQEIF